MESLYKAKRKRNDKWVTGWYCRMFFGDELEPAIIPKETNQWSPVQIKRETLCQYVGREDIRHNKVFEGDIVYCYGGECRNGNYEYFEKVFIKSITDCESMQKIIESEHVLIIDNVHDMARKN